MDILNIIFFVAFAASFISIPFLLFNLIKFHFDKSQPPNVFPTKRLAFFITPLIILIVVGAIKGWIVENEVASFIDELPVNYTVSVNRQPVPNGDEIISALKTAARQVGHHSHPAKRVSLTIRSEKSELELELRRDSEIPQEYWVYYDNDGIRNQVDIGKITTSLFDEY